MEKQKNNAVEKAENAAETSKPQSRGKSSVNKSAEKTNKRRNSVNHKKSKQAKKRVAEEKKAEKLRKKQEHKAEKQRIAAEKRVELARIKAHRKAEKEKAKAAILREKNRKKAEAKERRQKRLEERLARREALKHETKKQRRKRIAAEKAQKAQVRREEKARKAELKQQKFLAKKARKEQRAKTREKSREKNRGFGGWLAAVISLGVSTLVLASVLTFTFLMPTTSDTMLEAAYRRSFYDAVEQVDNMDLKLSKILATSDAGAVQNYLLDLAVNSELAENDLQSLPLKDESKFHTVKLVNQIGDYAKYLNKKLNNGENLTAAEKENLKKLYKANLTLKDSLQKTMSDMENDFSFTSMASGDKGNAVSSNFDDLENLSVEYPELIYDGPFSDGADDREIKGLSGEKITESQAIDIFANAFSDFGYKDIKLAGTLDGTLKCYNVTAEVDGETLFAQISETGGKIISFAYSGSCKETRIDGDDAIETALDFLAKQGMFNMKPVWINHTGNVYTINFAGSQNDVILYPDLVKIRVCAETATVIGMEATSYYTNHTERTIGKPLLSASQAREKISAEIDVITCRTVITPVGEKSEKLCYEFSGTYDGSTYYVYIDAETGRQIEMFKVITSSEGELLM